MWLNIMCTCSLTFIVVKVDYSKDEQWKQWVKWGVRKLVLKEDRLSPMAERKDKLVKCSFPKTGFQIGPDQVPPLEYLNLPRIDASVHTSLEALGNMDHDSNLVDQSGGDLRKELGWESNSDYSVESNTTVRCWHILQSVLSIRLFVN